MVLLPATSTSALQAPFAPVPRQAPMSAVPQ